MRIVAGKYRHRLLAWPSDEKNIRPTKDRIREAIFSSLGDISGLKVLDLYAGSGAMGLEALSRGAIHSTFVDYNKIAIETVKMNIASLEITKNQAKVLPIEDKKALSLFIKEGEIFDIIILDPPYHFNNYEVLITTILDNTLLSKNGIIVIESQSKLSFDSTIWDKIRHYEYGEINVDIVWRQI